MDAQAAEDEASCWRIDGQRSTCVIALDRHMPRLYYWGETLAPATDIAGLCAALQRPPVPGGLDLPEALTLLPESGTGFAALPGICVQRCNRSLITQLCLQAVEHTDSSICFTCSDPLAGLEVALALAVDPATDVLTVHNTLRNCSEGPLTVGWLASAVLPLPAGHGEVLSLTGRWAQEFSTQRTPLGVDALVRENRSGRSAQQSFPGLLTGSTGFTHESGEVAAMHLAWSGNHRLWAGRARDGQPFVQLGALLTDGEVVLDQGETWQAPPVHAAVSRAGSNGTLRAMHRYVRRQVLAPSARSGPRPVNFNSWEACYFDQSEQRTLALVAEAAALGAERFVLDDGWFRGRNSDRAGLGDWQVCSVKYPRGLEPIFDAVRAAGMQTGLWVEPEMVNTDSDLARAHPDWLLGDPQREQPLGRHQYALNLCLSAVFDFLLETVCGLVDRYRLDYLKWDMNRDLTHVVVDQRPAGEAITRASYRLLDAVRARFPATEIEICASGGARADFAMLSRGDRIWTSDNHDPHDRQRIQAGFSLFFPPEVMGAHIGSAVSDITGRSQALGFRIATALPGHLGIEPNRRGMAADERAAIAAAAGWYKSNREWLHGSDCRFLDDPDPAVVTRSQIAADGSRALLLKAQLDTPRHPTPQPLRCPGLLGETVYAVALLDCVSFTRRQLLSMRGDTLAHAGFLPPPLAADQAQIFELRAVQPSAKRSSPERYESALSK